MREAVMPSREEAPALVPPRGGVTWRINGDSRLFAASGYALLLQVAHPTVGAGVSEHSNFREDPWGRLLRTLDYTTTMVYGGPDLAWEMGHSVREMHKRIKGTRPDGRAYHALEPRAYAWVHATLAEAMVSGHRRFCSPQLSAIEIERFWAEWLRLGRLVGVREGDLPESWAGQCDYFERMVHEELEDTPAARDVLEALASPAAPPVPLLPKGIWRLARVPAARASAIATIGLMPAVLRQRLGLGWSRLQEGQLRALGAASRTARPVMPPALRSFGPSYLRWRGRSIGRGSDASGLAVSVSNR